MRVAFISAHNPCDIRTWSGTPFSMFKALQRTGIDLVPIYPRVCITINRLLFTKAVIRLLTARRTFPDRTIHQCRLMAADVQEQLNNSNFDVILSTGSLPVAYLRDPRPQVTWTDATFPGMVDFYPEYSRLTRKTLREGIEVDRIAFTKADKALFSSNWAARTATDLLNIPANKVEVHFFGSNMDISPTPQEINSALNAKKQLPIRLLWIGVDWRRKRGDFAVAVVESLRSLGINAELHLVGCKPPARFEGLPHITTHGFIAKSTTEGQKKISSLLHSSHFLLLPSTAECSPIVIPEAASHAVPSLATAVGGNPELVIDGQTGYCFPLETTPSEVATWVQNQTQNWENYTKISQAAYHDYQTRVNWDKSVQAVKQILQSLLL